MTEAEQKAYAQGRAAGLEEAAQACQQRAMNHASEVREDEADACADTIRALSPTPSEAGKDDARDAARYRWLRDKAMFGNRHDPAVLKDGPNDCCEFAFGEELDELIDAALYSLEVIGKGEKG